MAAVDGGQGLHTAPDWKVPERMLKKADHLAGVALKTIWQEAVRASPTATCQRCGVPATKRHVLWDCSWWQLHGEQVPHWWPSRQDPAYPPCLWDFGLLPQDPSWPGVSPILDEALILTGVLLTGGSVPPKAFAATDATGGAGTPACVQWSGASACTWHEGRRQLIGCATGCSKTSRVQTEARPGDPVCGVASPSRHGCSSDCKGAVARSCKGCNMKGRNLDIFGTAPTEQLDLHWVPSHLRASFGMQLDPTRTGGVSLMQRWTSW